MKQGPALRFVESAPLQSVAHGLEFHFAHDPFKPQNQPIVGIVGIVHPLLVGEQRPEEGTQLKEVMPVLGRPRQPTHLQAEDKAHVCHRDFGQQPLKPQAVLGALATLPLVLIDHQHAVGWPAESLGILGQRILPGRRFAIA